MVLVYHMVGLQMHDILSVNNIYKWRAVLVHHVSHSSLVNEGPQ